MFGLGKPRSKLGKFIDTHSELSQELLVTKTKLNRDTISNLCGGMNGTKPYATTQTKIVGALRRMGYDVTPEDFWP